MILKFKDFIKEAIVAFDGPNFSPKTVAQSMPNTHHDANLPRHDEQDPVKVPNQMLYSEMNGKYYDNFEAQDLYNKYVIHCKQNGETCDIDGIVDTSTLDRVLDTLKSS